MKIDKDSQLLWFVPNRAHHDMAVAEDGRIFVITSKVAFMQNLNTKKPIRDDFISIFDGDGKLIREVSLLDCLVNSPYVSTLQPRLRAERSHPIQTLSNFSTELRPMPSQLSGGGMCCFRLRESTRSVLSIWIVGASYG